MPPGFTRSFAERLDRLTRLSVSEARDGDRILPGHALVAPGDHHMEVQRSGANYVVRLNRQAQVNGHRPAVDVMFESLARCAGRNLLAGLLTGMGKDGARGLLAIRQAGGYTLAQDEATCVVYGMPREAVELGAAEDVLPLERIRAAPASRPARQRQPPLSGILAGPLRFFAAPRNLPRRDPADDRPEPRAFACSPSL